MRTKQYTFPVTKINERLAMDVFCKGMDVDEEGFPDSIRNRCVLMVTSALLGFRDPFDFINQALVHAMTVTGRTAGPHS